MILNDDSTFTDNNMSLIQLRDNIKESSHNNKTDEIEKSVFEIDPTFQVKDDS